MLAISSSSLAEPGATVRDDSDKSVPTGLRRTEDEKITPNRGNRSISSNRSSNAERKRRPTT